jgi:hypothetical protein
MVAVVRNRFYPHIALVLALFVTLAFSRTYYLRFLYDEPPMTTLMHLHGLVFTAWMALFVVQTRFIAAHRFDLHRKLGLAGVALAFFVFALGVATAVASAAVTRVRPSGLTEQQFAVVPLTSIILFAVLVCLGIALRRRADMHKRFMLLAMISVLGPAVGRIIPYLGAGKYAPIVQTIVVASLLAWCLVHDWRRHHIVHPVFAIGGLVLLLSWPFRQALARSELWVPAGRWLAEMGTFLVS